MAQIKPFKALRPAKELVEKVAALPYDVFSTSEARGIIKNNPYSFLRVDKAEADLDDSVGQYDRAVYEKASQNLNKMIEDGVLFNDAADRLYIYRLEMDGRIQTGLAALASIDEYISGVIKKHELTRKEKENDRIEHIKACKAHTGPIFMACRKDAGIKKILNDWACTHESEYAFEADDGVRHTLWVIDDDGIIGTLVDKFADVESLYIADGHHRNAAAAAVGLEMRARDVNYNGGEDYNYYLCVVFADDELEIMDYNRVVKDLNGMDAVEFLEALSGKFDITRCAEAVKPEARHEFGMYLDGLWYMLNLKNHLAESIDGSGVPGSLDVSVLHDHIIEPLLGIKDVRSDKRIDFIGGIRGISEISRVVDTGGMRVGFSMYPTSMEELIAVADKGAMMPPKSTWFEPKLRSGVLIHQI